MKKRIGILGGGVSALALAYSLPPNKFSITIHEKEETLGGLARSFTIGGFTFDIGPHIIFAKDKKILRWMVSMLGADAQKLYRRFFTYYDGRFIKYPFENGLAMLSPEDNFECLYHFLHNPNRERKPKNFREWIYHVFGKGIAEKYLIPYNQKVWNRDPAELTLDWVEGRVPKPLVEDVIRSSLGIETEGHLHQAYFYYPKRGGIQTFVNNIARRVQKKHGDAIALRTRSSVKKISKEGAKWAVFLENGDCEKFDMLVNTMPIHVFAKRAAFLPPVIQRRIKQLQYNSLVLVRLGFTTSPVRDKLTVHFPQKEMLFNRVTFNNFLSKDMSPKGKSSLTAEITYRPGGRIEKMSNRDLIRHVLNHLDAIGICDKRALCFSDIFRVQYEYPVYDKNYRTHRKKILEYFNGIKNFYYCGRFAEYRYINMNDCIKSAFEVSRRLSQDAIY